MRTVYVTLFGMSFYSSWDLQNLSTLSWWTSVHRVVSSTPLHAWALSCVHSLQPHGPCSPPGSSVHKLFQVRMLERIVTASSWRSSPPRNWTQVSFIASRFFTVWASRKALTNLHDILILFHKLTVMLPDKVIKDTYNPHSTRYLLV